MDAATARGLAAAFLAAADEVEAARDRARRAEAVAAGAAAKIAAAESRAIAAEADASALREVAALTPPVKKNKAQSGGGGE